MNEHAGEGDMILDADTLAEEILARPLHQATGLQRDLLFRERNNRLARFCSGGTKHPRCWMIVTAGSFRERKFWREFGAEVIVLHPGIDACILRVEEEQRGRPKDEIIKAIKRWH